MPALPWARPALGTGQMGRREGRAFISEPQLDLCSSSSAHCCPLSSYLSPLDTDAAQSTSLLGAQHEGALPAPPPVLWAPCCSQARKGHSQLKVHGVSKGPDGISAWAGQRGASEAPGRTPLSRWRAHVCMACGCGGGCVRGYGPQSLTHSSLSGPGSWAAFGHHLQTCRGGVKCLTLVQKGWKPNFPMTS